MPNELPPWPFFGLLEIHREVQVGDILTTVSILIAALTFWLSSRAGADAQWSAYYSELDRFYAGILRAAIKAPYLRKPAPISQSADAGNYLPYADPEKCAQYDSYAYLVWNFLETVYDRCRKDKTLREIWTPVMRAEDSLHRDWFLAQIHAEEARKRTEPQRYRDTYKFRKEFREFVRERKWEKAYWGKPNLWEQLLG